MVWFYHFGSLPIFMTACRPCPPILLFFSYLTIVSPLSSPLFTSSSSQVRAAWEVYRVQHDERDLIDTLIRICRDLKFANDESPRAARAAAATTSFSTAGAAAAVASSQEKKTSSPAPTASVAKAQVAEAMALRAETQGAAEAADSRAQALREQLEATQVAAQQVKDDIRRAKVELISQALSLMLQTGLVTLAGAKALLTKAANGDKLVDAVIEAYAHDRYVCHKSTSCLFMLRECKSLQVTRTARFLTTLVSSLVCQCFACPTNMHPLVHTHPFDVSPPTPSSQQ